MISFNSLRILYIMMVSRNVTELAHVSIIIKWVQGESLERLEGLPENVIKNATLLMWTQRHRCPVHLRKLVSGIDCKIGPWC